MADPTHGRRRGHPRGSTLGGHHLGVGDVPRIPRRPRPASSRHRRRHPGAPRGGARLRDGRTWRTQRARHPRRHRSHGSHRRRGDRGRRPRRFNLEGSRPPSHGRRTGTRNVRRRRRTLRHRTGAATPGPRSLRTGAGRRRRPGPRPRPTGSRLDAPPVRRSRSTSHVRAAPGGRRPEPVPGVRRP